MHSLSYVKVNTEQEKGFISDKLAQVISFLEVGNTNVFIQSENKAWTFTFYSNSSVVEDEWGSGKEIHKGTEERRYF